MKILPLMLLLAGLAAAPLAMADQPKMESALASLEQAKQSLEQASHDKGGHRAKAIQAVNQALREVKAGMEYDRTHTSPGEKPGK